MGVQEKYERLQGKLAYWKDNLAKAEAKLEADRSRVAEIRARVARMESEMASMRSEALMELFPDAPEEPEAFKRYVSERMAGSAGAAAASRAAQGPVATGMGPGAVQVP